MPLIKFFMAILLTTGVLSAGGPPNHLEPTPMLFANGLSSAIKKLLPGRSSELWMIGAPAFGPDYSIDIVNTSGNPDKPIFTLRFHQATKSYLLPAPPPPPPPPGAEPETHESEPPPPKEVIRTVPLEASFVKPISKIWRRVIRRTRYSEDQPMHMGEDGCLFIFGSGWYMGATWSPSKLIPGKLVELSDLLVELSKSTQHPDTTLQAKILSICKELAHALDSEPAPRWP